MQESDFVKVLQLYEIFAKKFVNKVGVNIICCVIIFGNDYFGCHHLKYYNYWEIVANLSINLAYK